MKKYILIILLILLTSILLYFKPWNIQKSEPEVHAKVLDSIVAIEIEPGMTFSIITDKAGLSYDVMQELLSSSKDVYDLTKVRAGKEMKFVFDNNTKDFKQLVYQIDTEEELYITKNEIGEWVSERIDIDYEVRIKEIKGSIDTSLYESAIEQGVDIRAIISLADVFAWTIDFAMGIRQGDTYHFIFEERYRDGEYVMPGKIIAAKFINNGKNVEGYYFSEGLDEAGEEIDGYYDLDGISLQKIFLKNPVSFKYISSGYTTGRRYVSAFNVSTGHRAIDYAASIGTPIKAVGEGTVIYAGWNSKGYGNFVSIRHNETFTTNYAHMSKIYVRYGQKVNQGDIVGTVGSTGFSTGPHLHFEMVKYGTKINPLTVDLPSDKAVGADKLEEFKQSIIKWQDQLNK